MPFIAEVVEQERLFTMRLKTPLVVFIAISIVHFSLGLDPLIAQSAAGPPGGAARGTTGAERLGEVSVSTVVVIKNLNSADSVAIADYYARKREVPVENVCAVRMADVEEYSYKEYEEQLQGPLKQFLMKLNHPIDYIVLTKGIPIRIHEGIGGGLSVDSLVVTMDTPEVPGFPGGVEPGDRLNPYFGMAERFRHARWGIYLVTRLIGYTRADCLRLV